MAGTSMGMSQEMRQKMTIAPQMRQSLEVLQAPLLELREKIQEELEKNPTLDVEDEAAGTTSIDAEREVFEHSEKVPEPEFGERVVYDDAGAPDSATRGESEHDANERDELDFDNEFEILARLDDDTEDYLFQDGGNNEYNPDAEERHQFLYDSIAAQPSLQEHLIEQLEISSVPDADLDIAEQLIGSIGDDGYLLTPLADIAQATNASLEDCERVLATIQDFTPSGVGARDLRECLLIQIRQAELNGTVLEKIVRDHLDLAATHNIAKLAKACDASEPDVSDALGALKQFNPRPGANFVPPATTYVIPEIEVRKVDGAYKVFVDDAHLPRIRISGKYRKLMEDTATPDETKQYIREKIHAGVFLIKSIEQRQTTIRRVAQEIVDRQQAFFDNGVEALKPLIMAEIATAVGVNESTVSRTVSAKYMRSPQGIHELRFFFTNAIPTESGASLSGEAVKSMLKKMVDDEDPAAPLADQDIEKHFADKGITIARRTIAKYRTLLKIPPSHQRRRG